MAKKPELELEPDAWQRFERAVDVVAKSPPQHRAAKKTKAKAGPSTSTKRVVAKRRNWRRDKGPGL
jgi:hypothetical protein